MTQILNLTSAKSTLRRMQLEIRPSQRFKELPQVPHMIFPSVAIDNNIINVPDRRNPLHAAKQHVDHALKNSGARRKPERQSLILPLTIRRYKPRLGPIRLLYFDLIKAITHIHNREIALVVK